MASAEASALSILDQLAPPDGFRTTAAFGTSYSAELLPCAAALATLAGWRAEREKPRPVTVLRSLDTLGDAVRIAVQQGRMAWRSGDRRLLALLDRIVRPVPFDERRHSFHPKVWVVRQEGEAADRWLLLVGSRNLTRDASWDFGVALEGTSAPSSTGVVLPRLEAFVAHVCEAIGETSFASRLGGLGQVRWALPMGVHSAAFDFQPGRGAKGRGFEPLLSLPAEQELILLSPFLDAPALARVADHWPVPCRLVGGLRDLEKVAREPSGREALEKLTLLAEHSLADEPGDAPVEDGEDEAIVDRGLHAKVALGVGRTRSHLLCGSPNLTTRGWNGANCEAFVALELDTELVKATLVDWVDQRAAYQLPEGELPPTIDAMEDLEHLRNAIAARSFRLFDKEPIRLEADEPLQLDGASLSCTRLTQPSAARTFADGTSSCAFPAAEPHERTSFLHFHLQRGDMSLSWVQAVELVPPIEPTRDSAALARILGFDGFLAYLQALIHDDVGDEADDTETERTELERGNGMATGHLISEQLRLENVLQRLCKLEAGNGAALLDEAERQLRDHRPWLATHAGQKENQRLAELERMFSALRRGWEMP